MELNIHGKQMDIGDALRTHIKDKIEELNEKYFNHAAYGTITLSREGHGHKQTKAHINLQMGRNILIVAEATAGDPYAAFDSAAEKAAKQLRRYKRKLRDHHDRLEQTPEAEIMKARDYVLAAMPETLEAPKAKNDNDDGGVDEPAVIAEMSTSVDTMSVSEAVMRLDLSSQPALLFRNVNHGSINMVYRRPDGNVGWVDPEILEGQKKISKKAQQK